MEKDILKREKGGGKKMKMAHVKIDPVHTSVAIYVRIHYKKYF